MALRPPFDVIERLPPGGADRLRALRQDFHDKNMVIPKFDRVREASDARVQAEQRLKRLLDHQQDGGFHLPKTDSRVIEQQRLVDKLTDDLRRINELVETRSAAWQAASHVLTAVEGWLRDGVPPGVVLEDIEAKPPQLLKGESPLDGILRLQRRGRELKADLARLSAAPYPSAHAKARMREAVSAKAMQGEPFIGDLVEHADGKIIWPTQSVRSTVYNTEVPSVAFAELEAATPLLVWVHADLSSSAWMRS